MNIVLSSTFGFDSLATKTLTSLPSQKPQLKDEPIKGRKISDTQIKFNLD